MITHFILLSLLAKRAKIAIITTTAENPISTESTIIARRSLTPPQPIGRVTLTLFGSPRDSFTIPGLEKHIPEYVIYDDLTLITKLFFNHMGCATDWVKVRSFCFIYETPNICLEYLLTKLQTAAG